MKDIRLIYGKDFNNEGSNIVITSKQMADVISCRNEYICKMIDDDMKELGNSWDNPPLNLLGMPIYRKSKHSNDVYEMYGTLGVMMIVCKIKDSVTRRLMIRAVNEAETYIKNTFKNTQNPAQNN